MYVIESDVAMVGLVVLVMLWDKYLRHRIEMTKLRQEIIVSDGALTKEDVLEIIEGSCEIQNQPPEIPEEIKIFK
jgi:hypothetical protein